MSPMGALVMGLVCVWTAAAHAAPLPLPRVGPGAAKADAIAFDGERGLVMWRDVDDLVLASRFDRQGLLDPGGFVVAVADRATTTDLALIDDDYVVMTAGAQGVVVTRALASTGIAEGPANHGRVACREGCLLAWVEVRPDAQRLHTRRLEGEEIHAVAFAAPLAGRAFSGVALEADERGWLLAWARDDGTFVQRLDPEGRPVGERLQLEGHSPQLVGGPRGLVATAVGETTRVTPLDAGATWSLPAGAHLCRVGDALRVTWQDGDGYTQMFGLDGAPRDEPTQVPPIVDLACAERAVGVAQIGTGVGLTRFDGEPEVLPTAVAPVETLELIGSPDGWLAFGRQGSTAFAVEIAHDLSHEVTVFADDADAVSAAFDGGWRVAWRAGATVWASHRGAQGWSEAAPVLEVAGLQHIALGRDLILWTTASATSIARFEDGVVGEPTEVPLVGGALRCGDERCVLLRHSLHQFIMNVITTPLDEGAPSVEVAPARVLGSYFDAFDAAPRGEQTLVGYVREGQLVELRTSATGVLIGSQTFGPGTDVAVAPLDAGWLIASARDGWIVGAVVAETGASHPVRRLVETVAVSPSAAVPRGAVSPSAAVPRVATASTPRLASGPGGVLLVHREGAFDVQRWVMRRVTPPTPLGTPCDDAEHCQSGFCVDGVCCEDACFGGKADCFSCADSARPDGECGVLAEGARCSDVDTACDPADRCDASGACVPVVAPAGTPCGDQGILCRVDDACDGLGVCLDGGLVGAGVVCGAPDLCGEVGVCEADGLCVRALCELCVRDCPPPPGCGNGVLDPGEDCDAGPNNAARGNHCRPWCALPMCGDGIVDQAEQCDLGADNGQGECTATCTRVRGPVTERESGCAGGATGLLGGLLGVVCLGWRRRVLVVMLAGWAGCGDTTREVPRDCAIDNGGCAEHATCAVVDEGVTCVCDAGWVGDGLTCEPREARECDAGYRPSADGCVDIDECLAGQNACEQRCVNTDGGFRCECAAGYAIDPTNPNGCVDIDECALGLDECAMDCTNTLGGYSCACATGFSGDGISCIDIDECATAHGCAEGCVNLYGSYRCTCAPGFALADDGVSCEDYDECAHEAPCEGVCTNTVGGFTCACEDGARLEPTDHCTSQLQTFDAPGTFVVPAGVSALVVEAWGGQGGLSTFGGLGGYVYARVAVTPGDVLYVRVGRMATGDGGSGGGGAAGTTVDPNGRGGGGGGASDVRLHGEALADRIVVAGGGGGGGRGVGRTIQARAFGGAGGGLIGKNGTGQFGFHGTGGTQHAGGGGAGWPPQDNGALGVGGASMSGALASGGGGGGGYYGGGAGESGFAGGAGGGGSSYVTPDATYVVHEQGVRSGHGAVHLRW